MKKSEKIHLAMLAVVESNMLATHKLEILAMLGEDKSLAEWQEREAEKREQAEKEAAENG